MMKARFSSCRSINFCFKSWGPKRTSLKYFTVVSMRTVSAENSFNLMESTKSVRVCVLKETCNIRVFQPCLHIRDDFLRTENTSSAAVICAFHSYLPRQRCCWMCGILIGFGWAFLKTIDAHQRLSPGLTRINGSASGPLDGFPWGF
jgi:hypothetical protein